MPYPPYSPDLTPRDLFFSFPEWTNVLKGRRFVNVEEVKQQMAEALKGIRFDAFKNPVLSSRKKSQ